MSFSDIADEVLSAFNSWTSKYHRNYYEDADRVEKLNKWRSNNDYILKHNDEYSRGVYKFKVAHNKYSDLLVDEFISMLTGFNKDQHLQSSSGLLQSSSYNYNGDVSSLPQHVDWRKQGIINPVQYQGTCGSCYAFSALTTVEAQHAKKTGNLIKLSEQNIVDCSHSYGNNGCGGGTMNNVFNYIKDNGVALASSYQYEERVGHCRAANKAPVRVTGYVNIPKGDEIALAHAVATIGPVAVGIDATQRSFQLYESGIYNDPNVSEDRIDHAVVVVGYGSEDGEDYWIVRNSWGEEWGEDGYVRMPRNQGNYAGIASMASYPIVEAGPGETNENNNYGQEKEQEDYSDRYNRDRDDDNDNEDDDEDEDNTSRSDRNRDCYDDYRRSDY